MSAIQQMLLGNGGASSFGLDGYVTNLWGAFSISKLLSSYGGDALTAVNTNTAASAGIGFSGSSLDTAALATLSGGTDTCVVSEYLNQEGTSARKFTATGTTRPRIVNSGVYDGKLVFDGTNDAMVGGANSGTPTAFTIFIRGLLRTTGTQIILEHSTNFNSSDSAVAYYDSGSLSVGNHKTAGAGGYYRSDFAGVYPNNNVQAWRLDRDVVLGGAAGAACFVNGALQTRTANGDVNTMGGNYAADIWYLAARAGTSLPSPLDLHTILIYESALSDADVTAISAILLAL
jgi:hypothetical protein